MARKPLRIGVRPRWRHPPGGGRRSRGPPARPPVARWSIAGPSDEVCSRMPSINVDLDYFDHPKTRRLIAMLGLGADILPIRLWVHVAKYHYESGVVAPPFTAGIESITCWWGQPGKCVAALIECGFLDQVGDSLAVHNWIDHAGHIHAGKVKAKAAAKARWDKLKGGDADAPSNAPSIAPGNALAMQGNAMQGNTSLSAAQARAIKRANFIPPSLEEVRKYCAERKNTVDPEAWFDHYQSNGWLVGKAGMSDWQAAVRTWEKNQRNGTFGQQTPSCPPPKYDPQKLREEQMASVAD